MVNLSSRIFTRLIVFGLSRSRMAYRRSGRPIVWKSCSAMRALTVWVVPSLRPLGRHPVGVLAGQPAGNAAVDRRTLAFEGHRLAELRRFASRPTSGSSPRGSTLFGGRASLRGCEARPWKERRGSRPHFQDRTAMACVYPTVVGFPGVTARGGWGGVFGRHVAQSQLPFGARDAVVRQGSSRHRGLEMTVASPKRGPWFRAYVHTPGWERVLGGQHGGFRRSRDGARRRVAFPRDRKRLTGQPAGAAPPRAGGEDRGDSLTVSQTTCMGRTR
jgi:hypothetical protein